MLREDCMTLKKLCEAAAVVYAYDDTDKACIRELAQMDREGLRATLENDPLVQHFLKTGINPMERT